MVRAFLVACLVGAGVVGAGVVGATPAALAAGIGPPQEISFVLVPPPRCNPECFFGVNVSEGTPAKFSVRVFTTNGQPTAVAKTFRIYTSDLTMVHPLCTYGSGSATPNVDYAPLDTTVTVPAGTPNGTVYPQQAPYVISTVDDSLQETNEQFQVNLSPGGNECVAIINNDNNTPPFGSLDSATPVGGGIRAQGWTIDPDTADPINVHIYVDGGFALALLANGNRPDVGAVYPPYGPQHGFDGTTGAAPGPHTVCAYAINVGPPANNTLLGCTSVTVPRPPFGVLDAAVSAPGGIRALGWTIDPDTADPINVHIYVDGGFALALVANRDRPDVGQAFPGYGSRHGYDEVVPALPGTHTICTYGINVGPPADNSLLGCKDVTIPVP